MVSSRELVHRALDFEPVPRVPSGVTFTLKARERFCATAEGRELFPRIDNDLLVTEFVGIDMGIRDARGRYVDEFGVTWNRQIDADIGNPEPCLTPETFADHPWPDPQRASRFDKLADHLKRRPEKFHVAAIGFSLFERAWAMRGMENLLVDFFERPEFVAALLDRILQFNLRAVEACLRAFPDVDAVYFGDDFGTQLGLLMGAERWREIFKPRVARQYGAVRAAGKKVLIHCCGKVVEILDDFAETGVNCFNPFQPEVMDVYDLLGRYHGRMAFFGGISTQRLLPHGSVRDVEQEVDRLLAAGRRGGYIIAPAHDIPGDARPENIAAMLRKIFHQ